jgi:phosphoglycolate phosphatase
VGNGARKLVERSLVASGGGEPAQQLDRAVATFLEHYAAHLLDRTALHGGIEALLRELSAEGVVLSVATNKPEAMARAILDGLGVGRVFVEVLGGDSVPNHKPDPAMLHSLAARTGIGPRDTLLVGDSPVDVATARAGGIAVCAVAWGLTPTDVLRGAAPDYLIGRPDELLPIVN